VNHPTRLGKYQIKAVLGEGAMGVVYKGFDPDIKRDVALKTIRRQLTDGSDFAASIAARFRNEAQAAGRLAHPGIVGVYEYGEDQQVAYIAMEYVEGQSIAHYIAKQVRFTDTDLPGLMSQLLDALDHAHGQGVWHRDIKPANVILSPGGRLKLADFGIARIDAGGLTQTHMMIGTPSYMAPEQFLGTAVDARVDIYSAGVLLYVLLTGQPPFTGPPESLMYKVVNEPPKPPSQVAAEPRPRFYDNLVAMALAKDPVSRFASARAFKQAIVAAVGQPIDETSWDATIVRSALRAAPAAAADRVGGAASPSAASARAWDQTVLAEARSLLARHVGPLATVLVRRAASECETPSALYAKLAEQLTDPSARQAFLGQLTRVAQTTGSGSGTTAAAPTLQLSEALQERAQRLVTAHIGPIAKILVRKAAAQSRDRVAFVARLVEAVPEAARAKLIAELERVP
jgi:serine/threonine-protein kinase